MVQIDRSSSDVRFNSSAEVAVKKEGVCYPVDDVSRIGVIGMSGRVSFFEAYYSDEPWMRSIIYYQPIK